ncbi:hypothetical protein [Methylobacterium sp. GC_Met_2]|uniref:hypothetical protein n=1 Tax=Methylobacterium sp. GC_Met_2 TaxID=2937376 RepID=UPI00226B2822|nr:hypothetical protein [Methylobacterium sp. GC_Met_2]
MSERLTLREVARRLDRDPTGLGRLVKKGQVPKGDDGKFDIDAVRAALDANTDPGRRKVSVDGLRSTPSRSTVYARPATGTFPTPDAYRDRADIGDAFARGALYGAHVVAFALPTAIACTLVEAGIPAAAAVQAHAEACDDTRFIVGDVTEALGLTIAGVDDAGPHAPTAFGAFDPGAFPGITP